MEVSTRRSTPSPGTSEPRELRSPGRASTIPQPAPGTLAATTSKLVAEPDGRWRVPTEFELTEVGFSLAQGPSGGAIDRIAFSGTSAGPKVAELERLRDTLGVPEMDRGITRSAP